MRTVTEHAIVWRGINATLEIETIRIGGGGCDTFHVTTKGEPLPMNHWDYEAHSIAWCLTDPDWFADQDPIEYALDALDLMAKGNVKFDLATVAHELTTRQGDLFS